MSRAFKNIYPHNLRVYNARQSYCNYYFLGTTCTYIVPAAEWLQWSACPLSTGRHWLTLGSNPVGSVDGVPDHA